MKRTLALLGICLAFAFPLTAAPAHFLVPGSIEPQKLIPPPPAADSLVEHAEIEVILNLQLARTPAQVARAQEIQNENVFVFGSDVVGDWFTAANLPQTANFFAELREDFTPVGHLTKETFHRRRPPFQDARIKPCVEFSDTSSYPSGHATQSAMWAVLLSEILSDHTAGFAARAAETRWYRVIGGAHHPTDVEAGRVLGEAEARELLKNPAVQKVIAELQAEVAPFLHKKAA